MIKKEKIKFEEKNTLQYDYQKDCKKWEKKHGKTFILDDKITLPNSMKPDIKK